MKPALLAFLGFSAVPFAVTFPAPTSSSSPSTATPTIAPGRTSRLLGQWERDVFGYLDTDVVLFFQQCNPHHRPWRTMYRNRRLLGRWERRLQYHPPLQRQRPATG